MDCKQKIEDLKEILSCLASILKLKNKHEKEDQKQITEKEKKYYSKLNNEFQEIQKWDFGNIEQIMISKKEMQEKWSAAHPDLPALLLEDEADVAFQITREWYNRNEK